LEFAKIINKLTASSTEITFNVQPRGEGDPQRRRPDITRAETILDWHPQVDLETGLQKTIPYFKQQLGAA